MAGEGGEEGAREHAGGLERVEGVFFFVCVSLSLHVVFFVFFYV